MRLQRQWPVVCSRLNEPDCPHLKPWHWQSHCPAQAPWSSWGWCFSSNASSSARSWLTPSSNVTPRCSWAHYPTLWSSKHLPVSEINLFMHLLPCALSVVSPSQEGKFYDNRNLTRLVSQQLEQCLCVVGAQSKWRNKWLPKDQVPLRLPLPWDMWTPTSALALGLGTDWAAPVLRFFTSPFRRPLASIWTQGSRG